MADVVHKTCARGTQAEKIANGVTLYVGDLVGLVGGYVDRWADGANDVFAGVVTGQGVGETLVGNTSGTPIPEAMIDSSGVTLMHLDSVGDTPTQAKVGDLVYCGSNDVEDMTLESSGRTHPIGYMSRYRSATDVDVTLFTPAEMLAQATA